MKRIFILLALVALISCQTLLFDQLNPGEKFVKEITNPDYNKYRDISIYGWFKINPSIPRYPWSTLVHFTHNPVGVFNDWTNPGDRSLAIFFISNSFASATYSKQPYNTNAYTMHNFIEQDLNAWAFFYIGHGSENSELYTYVQFKNTIVRQQQNSILHDYSAYYRVMIGQSVSYLYFPGNIYKVNIHFGPGAYRKDDFEALQNYNNPLNPVPVSPNPVPTCVTFYTECNYKGTKTSACGNMPKLNVSNIKAVYVPKGRTYTIYGSENYKGQKIKFTSSNPCIASLNWVSVLANQHTTYYPKSQHLKRNTHL